MMISRVGWEKWVKSRENLVGAERQAAMVVHCQTRASILCQHPPLLYVSVSPHSCMSPFLHHVFIIFPHSVLVYQIIFVHIFDVHVSDSCNLLLCLTYQIHVMFCFNAYQSVNSVRHSFHFLKFLLFNQNFLVDDLQLCDEARIELRHNQHYTDSDSLCQQ